MAAIVPVIVFDIIRVRRDFNGIIQAELTERDFNDIAAISAFSSRNTKVLLCGQNVIPIPLFLIPCLPLIFVSGVVIRPVLLKILIIVPAEGGFLRFLDFLPMLTKCAAYALAGNGKYGSCHAGYREITAQQ